MKSKIILNLAMSIDGYIASETGGYDWIVGDGNNALNTESKFDFKDFLEKIDIVVMGKTCYDQNMHKEFGNKTIYVATTKDLDNYDNIKFINGDICKTIIKEQIKSNKDIYLFGGGKIVHSFIKENIVDEYIIGIIPTILGKGIPLFLGNDNEIKLKLEGYTFDNGIAILKYIKRG
ncbi:MAG: dihydrofolate reductase family protein [Clostridium sp.]|uniref:dihydrofolate reductase family protein n=1 Tax=Clostridium sp. TaxID=1506 RepID=UPI003F3B31D7